MSAHEHDCGCIERVAMTASEEQDFANEIVDEWVAGFTRYDIERVQTLIDVVNRATPEEYASAMALIRERLPALHRVLEAAKILRAEIRGSP